MHPSLNEYEKRVEQGYLRRSETEDLVLYGYTDSCTFSKAWDYYTTKARGIVFEKTSGDLIALPFEKFFNLEEVHLGDKLLSEPFTVTEKMDGSLGILFNYDGVWHCATRGSFTSDQAVKAAELLKKYDMNFVPEDVTLLVEIIYPENKIVVDYGSEEKLVLLAAFNRTTKEEFVRTKLELIAELTNMPIVRQCAFNSIQEMVLEQPKLSKDQEGFVVRFESGYRIKIKGEVYCRIHRIISNCTPLEIWRNLEAGKLRNEYLLTIPEEHLPLIQEHRDAMERRYKDVLYEIEMDFRTMPICDTSSMGRKKLGLHLATAKVKHSPAMFPRLLNNFTAMDHYILKTIRPQGNVL